MGKIEWGTERSRLYEYGVDRGVYYPFLMRGVAWNGLVSVDETFDGGFEPHYLDGTNFLQSKTTENFSGSITALSFPDGFETALGRARITPFLMVDQQPRSSFGLSYRTLVAGDSGWSSYKLHLVYNAVISETESAHKTLDDNTKATEFQVSFACRPENFGALAPKSHVVVNSTEPNIAALEAVLYGSETTDPRLPNGVELITILGW